MIMRFSENIDHSHTMGDSMDDLPYLKVRSQLRVWERGSGQLPSSEKGTVHAYIMDCVRRYADERGIPESRLLEKLFCNIMVETLDSEGRLVFIRKRLR